MEAHVVGHASDAQLQHLAAVGLGHAAAGGQRAVAPVASVPLEAQLVGGALGLDGLEGRLLVQDGAVVAAEVAAERPVGQEKEAEHGGGQELQHVAPAAQREVQHTV